MSYAYVEGSDGSGSIILNEYIDVNGVTQTLSNDYTTLVGGTVQIFFDVLPTSATEAEEFVLKDSGVFVLKDPGVFTL